MPRRSLPDPLTIALGLTGQAEQTTDPARRRCLAGAARGVLAEALAALSDAHCALDGFALSVVALMQVTVDRRRQTIADASARLDALEAPPRSLGN